MKWFNNPTPAILLAGNRTGGTLLTTALSAHPEIFCARGEPFHHQNPWRKCISNERTRMRLLWTQRGYLVSMFKINLPELTSERWQIIHEKPNLHVLLLTRNNIIKQAVSNEINVLYRDGRLKEHPTQAYKEGKLTPEQVSLDVEKVQDRYDSTVENRRRAKRLLAKSGIPTLRLTYEELTGGRNVTELPQEISERICKFLGVERRSLNVLLEKVHKRPYAEFVTNWEEISELLDR